MSKRMKREEILHFENWHRISGVEPTVTVYIHRWFYHTPRVKLTMIEGYYENREQINEKLTKALRGEYTSQGFPKDYPKRFEIMGRPDDMLRLAEALSKACELKE